MMPDCGEEWIAEAEPVYVATNTADVFEYGRKIEYFYYFGMAEIEYFYLLSR